MGSDAVTLSRRLQILNLTMQHSPRSERLYLPTIADLIDRLSIVLLKSVFLNRDLYKDEIRLIEHDIDVALAESDCRMHAIDIRAVLAVMLANRFIWENESEVRKGSYHGDKAYEGDLLRATHSVNGVRNTAKNIIMRRFGGRQDLKIDCLAADLPQELGNWKIFD